MSSQPTVNHRNPKATAAEISTVAHSRLHSTAKAPAPLVSVVIPCYNGAPFLGEAIRSVLEQTYQKIEILVIDDGSTDATPEIAQRFPVRYFRQENRGLCEARNAGIRMSRGSYLVFLDADDRLRPAAIEIGVLMLRTHPECAMTVGDHLFIREDGSWLKNSTKECVQQFHYEALLKTNFIEMISSIVFRRSIFDQVGGFDPSLPVAEDYELYMRIAREHPIFCHNSVVAEYRIHRMNTSRDSELMLTMTLRALRRQENLIQGDLKRQAAFRYGIRRWRRQYGRQLAAELARSCSTLPSGSFRHKFLLLMHQYPLGVLLLFMMRVLPPDFFALLRRTFSSSRDQALPRGMDTPQSSTFSDGMQPSKTMPTSC